MALVVAGDVPLCPSPVVGASFRSPSTFFPRLPSLARHTQPIDPSEAQEAVEDAYITPTSRMSAEKGSC